MLLCYDDNCKILSIPGHNICAMLTVSASIAHANAIQVHADFYHILHLPCISRLTRSVGIVVSLSNARWVAGHVAMMKTMSREHFPANMFRR